jgi:hypothetical protein
MNVARALRNPILPNQPRLCRCELRFWNKLTYICTNLYDVKSKALLNLSSENNRDRYQIITDGYVDSHIYTHLQFRIFNLVSLFVIWGHWGKRTYLRASFTCLLRIRGHWATRNAAWSRLGQLPRKCHGNIKHSPRAFAKSMIADLRIPACRGHFCLHPWPQTRTSAVRPGTSWGIRSPGQGHGWCIPARARSTRMHWLSSGWTARQVIRNGRVLRVSRDDPGQQSPRMKWRILSYHLRWVSGK